MTVREGESWKLHNSATFHNAFVACSSSLPETASERKSIKKYREGERTKNSSVKRKSVCFIEFESEDMNPLKVAVMFECARAARRMRRENFEINSIPSPATFPQMFCVSSSQCQYGRCRIIREVFGNFPATSSVGRLHLLSRVAFSTSSFFLHCWRSYFPSFLLVFPSSQFFLLLCY